MEEISVKELLFVVHKFHQTIDLNKYLHLETFSSISRRF